MIDENGKRLFSQMMNVIEVRGMGEDEILDTENTAMKAFDTYMNRLNKTTGMLYAKNGEVLMKC